MPRKQKPRANRRLAYIIIGLAFLILGWGIWAMFHRDDIGSWIQKKSVPIEKALESGGNAFSGGDFKKAKQDFRQAIRMSREAQIEGRALLAKSYKKVPPPRKFIDPKQAELLNEPGQIMTFQILESQACYRLAATLFEEMQLRRETRRTEERLPAAATQTVEEIYQVIAEGLVANPQSTNLRVLKARVAAAAGQFSLAIRELESAIEMDEESAEAYNQLAMIYAHPYFTKSNNFAENRARAVKAMRKAIDVGERRGEPLAAPYLNLGLYYSFNPAVNANEMTMPDPTSRALAINYLEKYLQLTEEANPIPAGRATARKRLQFLQGAP